MDWTPLPKGKFTGIDWSQPDQTAGMDPYLIWAETDNFAAYETNAPAELPLIVELKPGRTIVDLEQATKPQWLTITPIYTGADVPPGFRYCTVRVKPEFFREFRKAPLCDVIERFELGLETGVKASAKANAKGATSNLVNTGLAPRLTGKVMGLIDGGFAFSNANFLRPDGTARTRYFWRQDAQGIGTTPADLGYGHELTGAQIDAEMAQNRYGGLVDEAAVYEHFELYDLRRLVSHGTHVMDIACGPRTVTAQIAGVPSDYNAPPSWELANDDASRCDIVAVQLDWDTVLDTSGSSMNVHILDALMYILARCEPAARVAVNISWGTLAGPHDGSSILEAAMDQLVALKAGSLKIVLPAGNSYQGRTHANDALAPGEKRKLTWCVQADDRTQSFLELWMAALNGPFEKVSVRLTPPGCSPLPWKGVGSSGMWTDAGDKPLCSLIFPEKVATGTTGTCALLALAPTNAFAREVVTAPCGEWVVEVWNQGQETVAFDAYIERDDVPVGVQGRGGRQSHFTDALYDTSGNPGSFVDRPDNPTLIRRSGTFNSIATGKFTSAVGGTRIADESWAHYSPRDPDPDAARARRPNVVKIPGAHAFSDEAAVTPGLMASGSMSGSMVRLVGTSAAAPQVTRDEFNSL